MNKDDDLYNFIANRIRDLREKKGLTKYEVSHRIGKSPTFMYELEKHRCNCKIDTLHCFLKLFNLSWSEFFLEDATKLNPEEKQLLSILKSIPLADRKNFIEECRELSKNYTLLKK